MKNKSVQNCRFVHHAKFHCIMKTLNRLFKTEFERGGELEKSRSVFIALRLLNAGKIECNKTEKSSSTYHGQTDFSVSSRYLIYETLN